MMQVVVIVDSELPMGGHEADDQAVIEMLESILIRAKRGVRFVDMTDQVLECRLDAVTAQVMVLSESDDPSPDNLGRHLADE
jgi:hypothetical protein